jgi:hypothetical protein
MISSETAVIYSYVLYLIGIKDYRIEKAIMRDAVARFFFMSALTGRYTNSPETRFESDLSRVRELKDGSAYLERLHEICSKTLTPDFWRITLPNQLATSASQSPSLFAYNASLIKMDAVALYSPAKLATLIDPAVNGTKTALERHHLFPRAYLESIGISDTKKINQIANLASVEWPENLRISKRPPEDYVPALDGSLTGRHRENVYFWHALPQQWWGIEYEDFLVQRRELMSRVIEKAWSLMTGGDDSHHEALASVAEIISSGEADGVEFKSTMRTNLHTGHHDDKMQMSVLKTIAGFLNVEGGTLLIGVSDEGEILGIEKDGFPNEDKMALHLVNLVKDRIRELFLPYVHPRFEDMDGIRIMLIKCDRGPRAAFLKDGSILRFYVRAANSTAELQGDSITDYSKRRFD